MKNTHFFIIFLSLCFYSCGFTKLDQKDRPFSISLDESKSNKTYIKEFNTKISTNVDSLKITINHAWLEKLCYYRANVFESIDSINKTLLMDISSNDKFYYNRENYGVAWIMGMDDSLFIGQYRNLLGVEYFENDFIDGKIRINIYKIGILGNIHQGLQNIGSIELNPR